MLDHLDPKGVLPAARAYAAVTGPVELSRRPWTIYVCDACGDYGLIFESQDGIPIMECDSGRGEHVGPYREIEVQPVPTGEFVSALHSEGNMQTPTNSVSTGGLEVTEEATEAACLASIDGFSELPFEDQETARCMVSAALWRATTPTSISARS